MAVVEENNKCEILGAGCGHSGRLPGKSRGSVEFVKLDIKVRVSEYKYSVKGSMIFKSADLH